MNGLLLNVYIWCQEDARARARYIEYLALFTKIATKYPNPGFFGTIQLDTTNYTQHKVHFMKMCIYFRQYSYLQIHIKGFGAKNCHISTKIG